MGTTEAEDIPRLTRLNQYFVDLLDTMQICMTIEEGEGIDMSRLQTFTVECDQDKCTEEIIRFYCRVFKRVLEGDKGVCGTMDAKRGRIKIGIAMEPHVHARRIGGKGMEEIQAMMRECYAESG